MEPSKVDKCRMAIDMAKKSGLIIPLEMHFDLGDALKEDRRADEAAAYYKELLKPPNNLDNHDFGLISHELGSYYIDTYDFKTAYKYLEQAKKYIRLGDPDFENLIKDIETAKELKSVQAQIQVLEGKLRLIRERGGAVTLEDKMKFIAIAFEVIEHKRSYGDRTLDHFIPLFNECETILKSENEKDDLIVKLYFYWNEVLYDNGEYDDSSEILNKLLSVLCDNGNISNRKYVLIRCLICMGNTRAKKAFENYKHVISDDEYEETTVMETYNRAANEVKEWMKSTKLASERDTCDDFMHCVCMGKAEFYHKKGDIQKYEKWLSEASKYKAFDSEGEEEDEEGEEDSYSKSSISSSSESSEEEKEETTIKSRPSVTKPVLKKIEVDKRERSGIQPDKMDETPAAKRNRLEEIVREKVNRDKRAKQSLQFSNSDYDNEGNLKPCFREDFFDNDLGATFEYDYNDYSDKERSDSSSSSSEEEEEEEEEEEGKEDEEEEEDNYNKRNSSSPNEASEEEKEEIIIKSRPSVTKVEPKKIEIDKRERSEIQLGNMDETLAAKRNRLEEIVREKVNRDKRAKQSLQFSNSDYDNEGNLKPCFRKDFFDNDLGDTFEYDYGNVEEEGYDDSSSSEEEEEVFSYTNVNSVKRTTNNNNSNNTKRKIPNMFLSTPRKKANIDTPVKTKPQEQQKQSNTPPKLQQQKQSNTPPKLQQQKQSNTPPKLQQQKQFSTPPKPVIVVQPPSITKKKSITTIFQPKQNETQQQQPLQYQQQSQFQQQRPQYQQQSQCQQIQNNEAIPNNATNTSSNDTPGKNIIVQVDIDLYNFTTKFAINDSQTIGDIVRKAADRYRLTRKHNLSIEMDLELGGAVLIEDDCIFGLIRSGDVLKLVPRAVTPDTPGVNPRVRAAVSVNTVSTVSLSNVKLDELSFNALCGVLPSLPDLTRLDLNACGLCGKQALSLSNALKNTGCLRELNVSNNPLECGATAAELRGIASLFYIATLESLDISAARLSSHTLRLLAYDAGTIIGVPNVRRINISGNQLGPSLPLFVRAFSHLTCLWEMRAEETFQCCTCDGKSGGERFPASLRVLRFNRNSLGDAGATFLATTLPSGIRFVDVAECGLGPAAARALMHSGTEALDISNNNVGAELANALSGNCVPKLAALKASRCGLGMAGLSMTLRAAAGCSYLSVLIVDENVPLASGQSQINVLASKCFPQLSFLDLSKNGVPKEEAESLAKTWKEAHSGASLVTSTMYSGSRMSNVTVTESALVFGDRSVWQKLIQDPSKRRKDQ